MMLTTNIELVNLTPHAVNIVTAEGDPIITVEPSGILARVSSSTVVVGDLDGIPITATKYGEVEGLPAPEPGKVYIVSSLVAQRCKGRDDVFIPNESVRDDKGRIVGCKSLGRV